jgi:NADH-quinone oxidoreductase subunit M
MSSTYPIQPILLLCPTAIAWALTLIPRLSHSRAIAVAASALTFAMALYGCVIDGISAQHPAILLLPLTPLILLVVLVLSPRTQCSPSTLRDLLALATVSIAGALSQSLFVFSIFSCQSAIPVYLALKSQVDTKHRISQRVFAIYAGVGSVCGIAGSLLIRGGSPPTWAVVLYIVFVLIRLGIFPFHAWLPVVFRAAPFGLSLLYTIPQLGALALLATSSEIPMAGQNVLVTLGLITSVLGGAQAVRQNGIREAIAYLVMSSAGTVFVGVAVGDHAMSGALILWMFSGIALSGIGLTLWVIEIRKGTLSLASFHGLYDRMPYFAIIFLLFGLAFATFPGSPGSTGLELLLAGTMEQYPTLSLTLFAMLTFNGIAIVRIYFRIFCGKKTQAAPHLKVLGREKFALALLFLPLLLVGLVPNLFLP